MTKCEDDVCIRSACLGLGLNIGVFAGLAALATGESKTLFFACSPEAHRFIEEVERGKIDMAIIAKDSRKEYTPAPEGLHPAVCIDVVDLGLKETPWGEKHKVRLVWAIEEENPDTGKPFLPMAQYTLSLNEKARLRQQLEAWRGRKFTAAELEGFDLEKLIGANCQLQLVHSITDDGRTFSNVQAIVPIGKGMTKMRVPADYVRVKDRQDDNGGAAPEQAETDSEAVPF